MKQFRFFLLCLTLCVLHFYCARHSFAVNGGGSEVEVTGAVFTSAGVPAQNAQVKLVPQNYNVVTMGEIPDSLTDTTDASGVYSFAKVKPGTYSIQAVQLACKNPIVDFRYKCKRRYVCCAGGHVENDGHDQSHVAGYRPCCKRVCLCARHGYNLHM
jgi:hypothetical protein